MSPAPNLEELLTGTFPLEGRQVPFTLSLATVERILPHTYDPVRRPTSTLGSLLRAQLYWELAAIDDGPVELEMIDRIMAHPAALSAVLTKRNAFYEHARLQGKLFALCPHDNQHEAEYSLYGLAVGVRSGLPDLFRADGAFFAVPPLSKVLSRGRRPEGVPLATRLRFELPSHVFGLGGPKRATGGVLAPLDLAREIRQWEKWLPPETDESERAGWWSEDHLGFRAVLRVASAIASLDRGGPATPVRLMSWPAIDLFFLVSLRVMTYFVDLPPDSSIIQPCRSCGGRYAPMG